MLFVYTYTNIFQCSHSNDRLVDHIGYRGDYYGDGLPHPSVSHHHLQEEGYNMVKSLLPIFTLLMGCSISQPTVRHQPERMLFERCCEKPDWVREYQGNNRWLWFDSTSGYYFIVGSIPNAEDLLFSQAMAQAASFGRLVEYLAAKVGAPAPNIVNLPVSLTLNEHYWEEWQINGQDATSWVYDVYTLSTISKDDVDIIIKKLK